MSDGRLLPQHQELVDASGIAPEVAEARGYRSITDKAELASLGFAEYQRQVPTLLVPIHDVNGAVATYQHRPDEPRTCDGKVIKYETVAGARLYMQIAREVDRAVTLKAQGKTATLPLRPTSLRSLAAAVRAPRGRARIIGAESAIPLPLGPVR